MKKESWIEGPDLPKSIIDTIVSSKMMCVTALNRTSTLFIGIGTSKREVILYDFTKDSWIPLGYAPKTITWCSSSSAHEKDYKQ